MKNKKFTYFLLAAVAGVWGFALIQIFGFLKGDDDVVAKKTTFKSTVLDTADESFSLNLNYRDPFLGRLAAYYYPSSQRKSARRVFSSFKKKTSEKETGKPLDISFIKYLGQIKNQKSGKQVALVNIHGKDIFLTEGDSVNNMVYLENLEDSLKILYQGRTFFINRN